MTQIQLPDLDPVTIEKLEARAKRHNRSLEAELKAILEQAAQAEMTEKTDAWSVAQAKLKQAQARFSGRTFSDSSQLIREDRER